MRQRNWPWLRSKAINLHQKRLEIQTKLQEKDDDFPGNVALVLISHVLGKPKSWILSHGDYQLSQSETNTLQKLTDQYLQGVPLPYLLGHWDFFGRTYKITPHVLIPRPETEMLVEKALNYLQKFNHPRIVDVGTGSGIIAISLAVEYPSATITAVDISLPALQVAQHNARQHKQTQVQFLQAHLLTPLQRKFDLICANLPYIPSKTLEKLTLSDWEPRLALDGGEDGLDRIEEMIQQARTRLASPGVLLLEIEANQGKASMKIAKTHFPDAYCQVYQDLAGRDRLIRVHNTASI